jgi:hypothetical protein
MRVIPLADDTSPQLYTAEQAIDLALLTTLLGREAGNQGDDAILAVGWTVRNRVVRPRWWGTDWQSVILCKWQYSSMLGPKEDPNLQKYTHLAVEPWARCLSIAQIVYNAIGADPTLGATHYFDRSLDGGPHVPTWATDQSTTHTLDLGAFHFFKAR